MNEPRPEVYSVVEGPIDKVSLGGHHMLFIFKGKDLYTICLEPGQLIHKSVITENTPLT